MKNAYRTESSTILRDIARSRRTTEHLRRNNSEKLVSDSSYKVYNKPGPEGDNVVPGMPWLESENPKIDWKERTVTIRKVSRESQARIRLRQLGT